MKLLFLTVLLINTVTGLTLAQDTEDFARTSTPTEIFTDDNSGTENSDSDIPSADDWKPKLLVTLCLTEDGQPRQVTRQVIVRRSVATDSSGWTPPSFSNAPSSNTSRNKLESAPLWQKVITLEPAVAYIWCDKVTIDITESEDGKSVYLIKSSGRTAFSTMGTMIDCGSFELKSNSIEITNAKIKMADREMQSEKLTMAFPVFGVLTEKFDKSINSAVPMILGDVGFPSGLQRIRVDNRNNGAPLLPKPETDRNFTPEESLSPESFFNRS